ncbi:MAG: hypothetical protein HGA19_21555 [Oscillochloris sp.]|nr:hypothetical protein [Oscillochloris sp.]
MRIYRATLVLPLVLALFITGCYQQRAKPSWADQWQAITQAARTYNSNAIPYSIDANLAPDDTNSLVVTVEFLVTSQDFFDVKYVDSRLATTIVVEKSGTSIGQAAVPDVRASAGVFRSVTVGPQEAIRTALALPAVQDFITAYDDTPSGASLFVSRDLADELGSPAAWTVVQEARVGTEIKSLRVWVDALTGKVLCVVTDGSLRNGCVSSAPTQ